MAIRFDCPHCGQSMSVAEQLAGQRGMCPHCRTQVIVPRHPPAAAAPPRTSKPSSSPADWFTFRRMITPVIIQILFALVGSLSVAGVIYVVATSVYGIATTTLDQEKWRLATQAVAAPFVAALVILIARLYAEVLIVIFRINETLTDILEELKKKS